MPEEDHSHVSAGLIDYSKLMKGVVSFEAAPFNYGLKSVESCGIFRGTKNGVGRNNKPPAMRAETKLLYKKHLSDTIELFSHYCKKGKVFHGKTVIRSRPYKVDV